MAIEHINPAEIYQPFNNFYTQVVRATGSAQVHVAGIVPLNKAYELIGEDNMLAQVRAILDNTAQALAAGGASPADVVRMNIYTIDIDRYRSEGHREVVKFFAGRPPTSTLVGVTRLADPRFLVEIEMTAVID